ncbi:MAG: chemotaxis protein CheW, partial [Candidatus Hydrothermarchaeales archaeon]
ASGSTLGLIVDSVSEVLRMSGTDIDPPSAASTHAEYVQGVGKLDDKLLILLDLNRILSKEEIVQIEKLRTEKSASVPTQTTKTKPKASNTA